MQQWKAGRVFILGLLVLTSYLLYLVFKPFLTSFAWAAFLAIPFYPLHQRLTRLFRGRVTLAAVATTLLITVLILLPIVVLVSSLAGAILTSLPAIEDRIADATGSEQADWQAAPWAGVKGAASGPGASPVVGPPAEAHPGTAPAEGTPGGSIPGAPPAAGSTRAGGSGAAPLAGEPAPGASGAGSASPAPAPSHPATTRKYHLPLVDAIQQKLSRHFDMSGIDLEEYAVAVLKRLGAFVVDVSRSFLGNALGVLTTFLMTMFMLGVFFTTGPRLILFLRRFMPLSEEDQQAVFREMQDMSRAIFYGVIMTAAIQALVGGIGWKLSGLPSAVIFGVAMFFCALVPVGGAALIWGPGALWLLYQGHTGGGIFLIVWGVLAVSSLDNILRPLFISGRTKAPMIPVMLGIFGGVAAFGMTGLFTGPLVVALFLIVLDVNRREFFPGEPSALLDEPGPPAAPASAAASAPKPPPSPGA